MSDGPEVLRPLRRVTPPLTGQRALYVAAAGFEDRCLGWCENARRRGWKIARAAVIKYSPPKGPNRLRDLKALIKELGAEHIRLVHYDVLSPQPLEDELENQLGLDEVDEVIVDISAMTKLLILMVLSKLERFSGTVRIVYSEAKTYIPTKAEYDPVRKQLRAAAHYPSRGAEQVVRLRSLSSIRMQGQPVTLIAFASFNEKLVSQMLGSVSPHRLILINTRPPRRDYSWREIATFDIHRRFVDEYPDDNPVREGLLVRTCSSLDYRETIRTIDEIYRKYAVLERIVCAATGSKMQTVGLFFIKAIFPDVQVEYPTPDSYYFKDMTHGVRCVYELRYFTWSSCLLKMRDVIANGSQRDSAGLPFGSSDPAEPLSIS